MARAKTFKNNGTRVQIGFGDGRRVIVVEQGAEFATDKQDEIDALTKAGLERQKVTSGSSSESSSVGSKADDKKDED